MSTSSNDPSLPSTVIVTPASADERDAASIRSQKRSLLARLKGGSAESEGLSPEELLKQWPTNPQTDQDAASLIFEDFCRRRQHDPNATSLHDYQERFPEHKESLARLGRNDAFLKSLSGSDGSSPHFSLPEVGDRLFGFRLLYELGSGSFARVFLASQHELASRPVVLKVSNLEGEEPQTMALMQHTHIVPIYSVHEDVKAGLRAVCMPFFGGASLSAVLKEAGLGRVAVRGGDELVRALQAVQAPLPGGPARSTAPDAKVLTLLQSYRYPQAAAWIVARLAEGLQHAHSRGVLHRDIKPSNVLIGMDGQPMLLDFNLAQVKRGEKVRIVLGGTINYMAPEHLHSLAARDAVMARQVDHRADIYSLGMVLFEMLVGRRPFAESASYTPLPLLVEAMALERGKTAPSLREVLPDAPWDLESITRKCLAPNPADRYRQADQLAEDLQRFLDDLPLKYAPQLSLADRWRKWRRRHPRLATAGGVGAVAVLLLATLAAALLGSQNLLATTQSQLGMTQEHLERAQALERKRAFRAGTLRALCLVNTTTGGQDQLEAGRLECEKTLQLYQILERHDWQQQPAWQQLDEPDRHGLAEDARELLLLLAWARTTAAGQDAAALHDALALLDRCEAVQGLSPLRALWEDRATYLGRLGEGVQAKRAQLKAAATAPASARDHYLLAISFARNNRHADAIAALNTALRLNPDHYWSLVQRGICYREQGELLLAAADFSRCAGLEPNLAWGHYNNGCILDQNQKREQAMESYSAALRCDKKFALAYLNRGLAALDLKQFRSALEDLDQAARLGRDDALLHLGRGSALEALGQFKEADAAFALALDKADALPPARQAAVLLGYGFAVYKRLPRAAETAFARVLEQQFRHPKALYGKAMVLVERREESAAIACFDEALGWHPGFVDGHRCRAVLLARQGKFAEAQQDINCCLLLEGETGITLYAAACITARAAIKNTDPDSCRELEDRAIALVAKAIQKGYGLAGAAIDPDLQALHHRPEFRALLPTKKN